RGRLARQGGSCSFSSRSGGNGSRRQFLVERAPTAEVFDQCKVRLCPCPESRQRVELTASEENRPCVGPLNDRLELLCRQGGGRDAHGRGIDDRRGDDASGQSRHVGIVGDDEIVGQRPRRQL